MVNAKNNIRSIMIGALGATVMSVAFTGTTAHAADWMSASAPITYKGSNPYATGYRPAPAPHSQVPQYEVPQYQAPKYNAPQYSAPQQQAALPQPTAPMPYSQMAPRNVMPSPFNPNSIDRNLYKHQKVGKPYTVLGQTYYPQHDPSYDRTGTASWYGDKFHGKPTANGETFDKNAMTAAHPTLPLNSWVYVTNLQTGQVLKVRLNDRGPFIDNRLIDLSEAAANALGIRNGGLAQVRVQYAGPSAPNGSQQAYQHAPRPQAAAPVPVMPAPPVATPFVTQPIAPRAVAPQPQAPVYRPLRQQVQPPMQSAQLPQVAMPTPAPIAPQVMRPGNAVPATPMLGLQLPNSPIAIPQASPQQPDDGSIVTLTIKGPIHMAGSRDTFPSAQLTKAVNRMTYRTN